ncbi:S-adenosyl-L-methionine-dependent methyltransferase [Xylariales sp. PMI_506]|nr:S-adenosyl-L-methionine-dependent methyltransferase [Xylariales sp. PMI_506]
MSEGRTHNQQADEHHPDIAVTPSLAHDGSDQWFNNLFAQAAAIEATSMSQTEYLATLPSQVLGSYGKILPPRQPGDSATSSAQEIPAVFASGDAGDASSGFGFYPAASTLPPPSATKARDVSFAEIMNDMINKELGRVSEGNSVIEPDSVLGESGRLYHGYKDGSYFLPNDAAEQDRLDLQHQVFRLLFDGWLALAPFTTTPKNVIDIATGTGIWAQEFAEQNPSSYVIGTDLSSIQPLPPRVPNCSFVKADAEESWIFPTPNPTAIEILEPKSNVNTKGPSEDHFIKFDYVHMRAVISCFDNTKIVFQNAYDNMNPGGYIEIQDWPLRFGQANPEYKKDAVIRYGQGLIDGAAACGRDIDKAHKYKGWLEEIGFVDVTDTQYLTPLNPWPQDARLKKVGLYALKDCYDGARGSGWKMLRAAGYAPDAVENLIVEARNELRDPNNHVYAMIRVVIGRKLSTHEA